MNNNYDLQTTGPKDPVTHPDVPDTPHPASPDPTRDPPDQPNPYPVTDPLPGSDPGTEPIREPVPIPTFPEPMPGTPPDADF